MTRRVKIHVFMVVTKTVEN